jgi:F0F1-type ATP synthase delta subunit
VKRRRAAAPYARALYALSQERDETELIGRELGDVAAIFESVMRRRLETRAVADWAFGSSRLHT